MRIMNPNNLLPAFSWGTMILFKFRLFEKWALSHSQIEGSQVTGQGLITRFVDDKHAVVLVAA